ncbi:PAAR domain-containing protein [Salmonella enterica]|uniref:PAAR domain-containing protein n=1 Tax=Salmonella enterica TaxID=28901 RepID=UPI001D0CB36B|nr:PAAR domain-containing protein [Salmonella enterica]
MMSKAVALKGHRHTCPKVDPGPKPHVGGPISECQQSFVTYNGIPLALVGDKLICEGSGSKDTISTGSATMKIMRLPKTKKILMDNGYVMDKEKRKQLLELLEALENQQAGRYNRVIGFVVGQSIDENYKLVTNLACPDGMSSLSLLFGDKKVADTVKTYFNVDVPVHPNVK